MTNVNVFRVQETRYNVGRNCHYVICMQCDALINSFNQSKSECITNSWQGEKRIIFNITPNPPRYSWFWRIFNASLSLALGGWCRPYSCFGAFFNPKCCSILNERPSYKFSLVGMGHRNLKFTAPLVIISNCKRHKPYMYVACCALLTITACSTMHFHTKYSRVLSSLTC